ncbi:MAG: hypothetical protein AUJ98_06560 [Bacteroidetes bacterium CG2_30_33_31]|nr:MAG: hypothetical protein AUJ98_06560 [Bacteroidetes bacterium CG2_30_33_31]
MSKSDNYIDKLFQDGLSDFSYKPSDDSFEKILKGVEIAEKTYIHRKRNKIFAWIGFSAATLILVSYIFFLKSCNVNGSIADFKFKNRNSLQNSNKWIVKFSKNNQDKIYSNQKKEIYKLKYLESNKIIDYRAKNNIQNSNSSYKLSQFNSKFDKVHLVKKNNSLINTSGFNIYDEATSNKFSAVKKEYDNSEILIKEIEMKATTKISEIEIPLETSNNSALSSLDTSTQNQLLPLPSPTITSGLLLNLGFGFESVENNLPSNFIYDKPMIDGQNDNKIKTFSSSLLLEYRFSNFFVKSGLGISEFGENTTFNITNTLHDTSGGYTSWDINKYYTYDTVGYFDDPLRPGLIFPILSSVPHIDTLASQWNSKDNITYSKESIFSKNRYRYIEIPLIIGFQYNIKKMGLYAGGGISYGIMTNSSGKFINDNNLIDINFKETPFKRSNLNYILNIGTDYALSNNWNIFIQANFKANITSIFKPEFDLGTKYKSYGINIGLSYIIK